VKFEKIKKPQIVLGVILLLGAVRLFLAYYLPILGDGGAHAHLVENIMRTGLLPPDSESPALLHSYFDYPVLFHLESSILGLFVGSAYKFLPAMAGIITIVILYLLIKELIGSEVVALFVALFAAVHPWHILFSSVFLIETTLIMFIFLTLWSHVKFVRTGKKSWLLLTGIFLGASIATKQIGYILPFILIIQHLVLRFRKNDGYSRQLKLSLKEIAIIVSISAFVFMPFLSHFYQNTGTIFQPSNPLTNWLFFKSKVVQDPQAAEFIYNSGLFKYEHFDPTITPDSIIKFYCPGTYYSKPYSYLLSVFFLISVIAGGIYLARRKPRIFLYLLVFIIGYHALLTVLQTQKYFIQLKLIAPVFMASSILFIKDMFRGKRAQFLYLLVAVLLIVSAAVLYVDGIKETKSKYYSMCWLPTNEPITNLIDAYTFIKEHSSPDDVVADPSYTEGIYYTDRETFWLTTSGGVDFYLGIYTHDKDLVSQSFNKYHIRYLVVIHKLVSEGEPDTEQFIRYEDYLFVKESSLFKLVFEKPGVEVYEFKGS
jgi:4-amino-4-deoxy-L-arabinose transferase-like glycosyltransferase